jgi:hypothetical protein
MSTGQLWTCRDRRRPGHHRVLWVSPCGGYARVIRVVNDSADMSRQPISPRGTAVMIDMRKLIDQINDPDRLPNDDYTLVSQEIGYLNRIDQEWLCVHLVMDSYESGPDYCGLPEHDPFTNRCWDHTPDNLSSWHM